MAVLNLSVTISDKDLERLLEAARATFSADTLTVEQMTEMLRQYGINQMKQMVHGYERRVAVVAAENGAYEIEVA